MSESARAVILERISAALGRRGGGEYVSSVTGASPTATATPPGQGSSVPGDGASDYFRTGSHTGEDLVDLLIDRLVDYRANVHRAQGDPAEVIANLLDPTSTVVVPPGLEPKWMSKFSGIVDVDSPEHRLGVSELDGTAAVVTASAVSIAQTGTIVLDGSAECGRRAISLVPDHHVCIVREESIVDIVPEAMSRLAPTAPLTLISGPSATSDIELSRVEGVHGPRTLDVIILAADD